MISSDDVIDARHALMVALDDIAPNQACSTALIATAIDRLIQIHLAILIQNSRR